MKTKHLLAALAATAVLAACESPEQIEARQTQFNGQSLDAVITAIGKPNTRNAEQAIWTYRRAYSNQVPIQSYINGRWITTGYRTERGVYDCTYTATLKSGRVTTSAYEGNSCRPYAPKIKN